MAKCIIKVVKKEKNKKRSDVYVSKKGFLIASIALLLVGVVAIFYAVYTTKVNKAYDLEEQINESKSAIQVQEKRRTTLIYNLVDTVKNYDKHESSTLTELAKVRSSATSDIKEAKTAIQAVTESYPELKSQANYKALMTELSTTENLIAEYRNNFNLQVKAYNKYTRKFPNSMFLNMAGYEKIEADYLTYTEEETKDPTNLFGE